MGVGFEGSLGLLSGMTPDEIAGVKHLCEKSQHYFTKFFYKAVEGKPFRVGPHHKLVDDTLDRVVGGEISRLIVNEPPGFSKTVGCVVMFTARGFALNPRARFLHASYSEPLVLDNSTAIRAVMATVEYRHLWGRSLRTDTTAKNLWRTPEGGAFKASPSRGSITGFRSGNMDVLPEDSIDLNEEEIEEQQRKLDAELQAELDATLDDFWRDLGAEAFSGALIIDDPLKPDDAKSDTIRKSVNDRYMNTFRSRLAHERVPIIVVGQRVHQDDFSHHLLTGGGGEKFHHLLLPVEIKRPAPEKLPKGATKEHDQLGRLWPLPKYLTAYTHGIPIIHDLPAGPLWRAKLNEKQIDVLRRDSVVFSAQYDQDPKANSNATFKPQFFRHVDIRPRTLNIAILVDPSGGKSRTSDRTAMPVIGIDARSNKFLLDGFCHRMKLSERWENLRRLYERWHNATGVMEISVGYERYGMQADLEYIEERQQQEGINFPITEVSWAYEGPQSKEARIERLQPDFKNGRFYMPSTVYSPERGTRDTDYKCFWEGTEAGVEFRPAFGTTSLQRSAATANEAYRIMGPIIRRDENGQLYDLSLLLMQELQDFPNALYKDLSDATSRIYDLQMTPASKSEQDEVEALNASLES